MSKAFQHNQEHALVADFAELYNFYLEDLLGKIKTRLNCLRDGDVKKYNAEKLELLTTIITELKSIERTIRTKTINENFKNFLGAEKSIKAKKVIADIGALSSSIKRLDNQISSLKKYSAPGSSEDKHQVTEVLTCLQDSIVDQEAPNYMERHYRSAKSKINLFKKAKSSAYKLLSIKHKIDTQDEVNLAIAKFEKPQTPDEKMYLQKVAGYAERAIMTYENAKFSMDANTDLCEFILDTNLWMSNGITTYCVEEESCLI